MHVRSFLNISLTGKSAPILEHITVQQLRYLVFDKYININIKT